MKKRKAVKKAVRGGMFGKVMAGIAIVLTVGVAAMGVFIGVRAYYGAKANEHAHEYAEGSHKCTICGEISAHEYAEGSHECTICGAVSEHQYEEGSHECTICGELSEHEYVEGSHVCTVCGETSAHEYAEGSHVCTICGETSAHEYAEGSHVCTICGELSAHQYEEGSHVCTVCGELSAHQYEEGSHVCTICGAVSEHVFEGESDVCTVCSETVVRYTVTFVLNGGEGVETAKVESEKTLTAPETPTREGWVFKGWFTNSKCTKAYNFSSIVTMDFTLYAKWAVVYYNVTFINEGVTVTTQNIAYGRLLSAVSVEKEGFTLGGWYDNEECRGTAFDLATPVTSEMTLYAKWICVTHSFETGSHVCTVCGYQTEHEFEGDGNVCTICGVEFFTVTFNLKGGTGTETAKVESGKPLTAPEEPIREGYLFKGWYINSLFTKAYNFSDPVERNFTLYARWTVKYYDIPFMNGDEVVSTQHVRHGNSLSAVSVEKEGFTFGGWYDNAECSGTAFDFATPVTIEFTLYARWLCETHTYAENSHVCTVCGYVSEADYSGDSYGNVCSICGGYRIEYNVRSEIKAAYPQLLPTCAKAGETMSFTLPETMTATKSDGVTVKLTDISFSAENYMSYGGSPIACTRTGNTWEFTVPTIAEGNYIVIYISGTVEEVLPEGFYKLSYETVGSFTGGVDCPGYGKAGETVTVLLYPAFDPIQGTSTPITGVVLDTAQSVGITEINVTISENGEATVTFIMPAQEAKLVVTVS